METNLNYRVIGLGHPVLFLHGFLESNSMWDFLNLESLNFQAILIELPGHGKSLNEDNQDPSLEYMADRVMKLLRSLNIDSFSVVGHSMGGYVALLLKEKVSQCKKVVLLNSNFWEDSVDKKRDRIRVASVALKNSKVFIREAIPNLFTHKIKHKEMISELITDAQKMEAHAIAYASLAMRERKNKKILLESYPNDFLIIQGEEDTLIPVNSMRMQLAGLNMQLHVIPNSGHMTHVESTDQVFSLLYSFLVE
jgi:2-succinyl-6-hydroxy-2,4-cyclohexadiene-1-carboxylate synthase